MTGDGGSFVRLPLCPSGERRQLILKKGGRRGGRRFLNVFLVPEGDIRVFSLYRIA